MSANHSCQCCGEGSDGFQSNYEKREHFQTNKIALFHVLGPRVVGFCVLHALCRMLEATIISFTGQNEKILDDGKFVRPSWEFQQTKAQNPTFKCSMIFGEEAEKILNAQSFDWLKICEPINEVRRDKMKQTLLGLKGVNKYMSNSNFLIHRNV